MLDVRIPGSRISGSILSVARAAPIWLVALLGAACATATSSSQFEALALASEKYAKAVDGLLERTVEISLDASSIRLLENRDLAIPDRKNLKEQDVADKEYLKELGLVRNQAHILSEYFIVIHRLSESSTPYALAATVEGTVANLDELSKRLREKGLTADIEVTEDKVARTAESIARGVQNQLVRSELTNRRGLVSETLVTQAQVLKSVRASILHDLALVRGQFYRREVVEPYVDPESLSRVRERDVWVRRRRELLADPDLPVELELAVSAADGLRRAWEDAISGMPITDRLRRVARDLEPILAALQTWRNEEP